MKSVKFFTWFGVVSGFLALGSVPQQRALAERTIEWRDDGLWVIDSRTGESRFEPLSGESEPSVWAPRVAAVSPDENWVAYVRHTGGGYEDEGQSCFVARWDGSDEHLILASDRTVPAIYWLEGNGQMFLVVQQVSGGTAYRSFFSVVDFETGEKITDVEGLIYGTSSWGTRAQPSWPRSIVGVRYEILCQNEEPCGWGTLYVDELIDFGPPIGILGVYTGGLEDTFPVFLADNLVRVVFDREVSSGMFIMTGWSEHQPPEPGGLPWEGRDYYRLYARPRTIALVFDDGGFAVADLEDTPLPQWVGFPEGTNAREVTIEVWEVYQGLDNDCPVISGIYLPH